MAGRPGFLARWAAAVVAGVAAAVTVVFTPAAPHLSIRSDGCGYHVWTYALLKGDLSFRWFEGDESHQLDRPDPNSPRLVNKYPPGVALIRLPAMAWVVDASRNGPPYGLAENRMVLVLGAAALVGVVVLGLLACRELGVPPWSAQFAVLVLTFGTGLFHYGTFDAGFSHVYSALGAAWLVWYGLRSGRVSGPVAGLCEAGARVQVAPGSQTPATAEPGSPSALGVAGVAVASLLLVLVRSTNVFLIGFWAAGVGWRAWRRGTPLTAGWAAVVGSAFGVGLLVGLNTYTFGRLTMNSYPGEEFLWDRPMMLSVLFAWHQGLVPYYPALVATVVIGLSVRGTRVAAVGLAALLLCYAALYGYWWSWHLGDGFGHRGFVELVPFAVPVLAAGLANLSRRRPRVARGVAVGCLVLAGWTVGWMCDYWDRVAPW